MTKELKKKDLLVSTSKPFIVRHARNEKHNEVTVVVLHLAIPIRGLGAPITPSIIERVKQVGVGFPDINLQFNFKPDAPAFLFTVKGKAECRGTDTPNQEIGDMVAMAKAQAKAAKVAARVTFAIREELAVIQDRLTEAIELLARYRSKEHDFLAEEKYMKVLEKRANKN